MRQNILKKIAFLCITPLEKFSAAFNIDGREYFQWLNEIVKLRNLKPLCKEIIEIYGEYEVYTEKEMFDTHSDTLQLLYVQSNCEQLLGKVFGQADLVIVGLPVQRKEFDKMFMVLFPWKDQVLFLWDNNRCRNENFLKKLCRDYKLREEQLIEIKRGRSPV